MVSGQVLGLLGFGFSFRILGSSHTLCTPATRCPTLPYSLSAGFRVGFSAVRCIVYTIYPVDQMFDFTVYPVLELLSLGQGSGFRVRGSGFRVQGSGCRGQGSGVRGQGSGVRVQGSGV